MPVYRQVSITYWQDKFVLKLTPEEKFFYIYLLTNSKTKQCGIYELPLQVVQFETGFDVGKVGNLLKKFEEYKRIIYDYETDEIAILNWRKYNDSTSHKTQVCVMGELAHIKSRRLLGLMGYEESQAVFANKSYRVSDKLRSKILLRDEGKCKKCGSDSDLTIDHIFPRSLGGGSDEFNLRTLCRSCNSKRILIGEQLRNEIIADGYDYEKLKNTYQSPIGGVTQKEKEKEEEQEKEEVYSATAHHKSRFEPPKIDAVCEYGLQIGLTRQSSEHFFDHFESNGWRVGGKSPMKNWQSAMRNWKRNETKFGGNGANPQIGNRKSDQTSRAAFHHSDEQLRNREKLKESISALH